MKHEEQYYLTLDEQVLMELSLSNLKNNVSRSFGKDRETKSTRIQVTNYEVVPSVGDKNLLLKARIVGEEANYQVHIRFNNVTFSDIEQPGFIKIKAMDGRDYYIKQMTSSQSQIKVKCNCLDFYYRFSVWNHNNRSLEGPAPPPYIKKTDRPPVNPNRVSGACKHIIKMINFLKGERIIR